jgi:hypothetical protein
MIHKKSKQLSQGKQLLEKYDCALLFFTKLWITSGIYPCVLLINQHSLVQLNKFN